MRLDARASRTGRARERSARRTRTRAFAAVAALLLALTSTVWLSATSEAAPYHARLRRAPYLTDLVGLHVLVNWATDRSATTGSVRWGRVTGGTCTLTNAKSATRTSITVGAALEYQWRASLTLPSTGTYCYRPLLASTDLLGSNSSPRFVTQQPAGSTATYSFGVFGDWGAVDASGNNADQANLMSRIATAGLRFVVTTGDNAYPSGTQKNYGDLVQRGAGTSAVFGPSFWTVPGSSVPIFPAVGNHGLGSGTPITNWPQVQAVSSSGGRNRVDEYCCVNGTAPTKYASTWYAFDAGPARIYVLASAWGDTNGGDATGYANDAAAHFRPGTPEYEWLANDLRTHPSALKFAVSHYPVYSDNQNHPSDTYLQGPANLEGLLTQYGVDLWFTGHAHIYERNLPSRSGAPVTYVTGGGGSELAPVGPCRSYDAYAIGWSNTQNRGTACGAASAPTSKSQAFHFLKVTVANRRVTVTPTDSLGRIFDVRVYDF